MATRKELVEVPLTPALCCPSGNYWAAIPMDRGTAPGRDVELAASKTGRSAPPNRMAAVEEGIIYDFERMKGDPLLRRRSKPGTAFRSN